MLERVPIPLPLLGLSEAIAADQQEPGTTARALNVRGVDPRSPGRIRLAQRSGLEPHGTGAVVSAGSPVVTMFQAVKDTPPEKWVENGTATATEVVPVWTSAVDTRPLTAKVGPDGNCYTLLASGAVVIHSERGKLLGTIDAQAPVGFSLVPDIGIDEDGAVYTMAAHARRIDGGAGRLYRFRKRDDFWERESTFVVEWRPRAFIYDRGEVLATCSRPDDWVQSVDQDGLAPLERLYRYAGVKGEAFGVWHSPVASPAVQVAANVRGDVLVASARNVSRTTAAAVGASIDWDPREAITATVGVDAKDALYLHLSALRAQAIQGLTDNVVPAVWEEARRDPSDFPVVIDATPRGFVSLVEERRTQVGQSGLGGILQNALLSQTLGPPAPKFDTDGMTGVPGFVFTGTECFVSRASTGFYEKETLDGSAGHCRSLFPNMRDAAGAGTRFIVNVTFRIDTVVAGDAPRYVFQQGFYSLFYDENAGNTRVTFTYPNVAGTAAVTAVLLNAGNDPVGLTARAMTFTLTHNGHNVAGSVARLQTDALIYTVAGFAAGINRTAERTVLGGYGEMTSPAWASNQVYLTGARVWHKGVIYECIADHSSAWPITTEPPEAATYWIPYTAKLGLKGAIAEALVFLGGSSAATAPHDTSNTTTMRDYMEGYTTNAYGRQGILDGAGPHPYAGAPPPGAGSPVNSADFGGINIPQGLTVKYSRADGSVMWILNTEPNGNGVAVGPDDYFYAATVENDTATGITRAKQYKDLGVSVLSTGTTIWSVLDSAADSWLGDRIQMTVDACGDLYLPYVDAEAATDRKLVRYKFDGNGLGGPALRFEYTFPADKYPVIAVPGGLAVDERLGAAPALWSNATTYTPGNRVKISASGISVGRRYECIATNLNQTPPNATYWVEVDTCGPEFLYVPVVRPAVPGSTPADLAATYDVLRVDVMSRVATGSTAPREVQLLAVTENGTVSRYQSNAWASVSATVLPGTYVWSATLFSRTFLGNGSTYRVYDHQTKALRAFEEATVGRIPPRCRLGCAWRGRLVIARGDSAHDWYMSATADAFDWEFQPDVVVETQAVSGASSQVGEVPDLVNALVPWSDDLMLFGCDSSIWRLTGDPMVSGELHRVSDSTGMAFGDSWCVDERGMIYFFGSRGGFYAMTPDGGVQPLSEGKIHRRLQEVDLGKYSVRVVWNDLDMGAHIFLVPTDGKGEPYHYFYERATGAFWADQIHSAERQVRGVYLADGDAAQDRALLLGCADGRIRRWSSSAPDDDGEAIRSSCLIGPVTPDTMGSETRVTALEAVLARDQGGCIVGVMGTSEADVPYSVESTSLLSPGRNGYTRIRARGAHLWVEVGGAELGQPWAVEDLALHVAAAGRKRAR
jgi:hypothetical protein